MMSPRLTLPVEKEGPDVDGADQDGVKQEGGATDPDCLDLNYVSLRLR